MRHGCQRRADIVRAELKKLFPHAGIMLRFGNPWELLVAVQLSAQCTDKKVNEVTERLFEKYRTLEDYCAAAPREFERDIFQTGFFRNKTKNILAAARMVRDVFGGTVPRTMREMLAIPGVGRKTANVVLGTAYGVVSGMAVDTHVRRLARLFKLTAHTKPDKIEEDLIKIIPRGEWYETTYRLIEYGRKYCTARCKHTECPIVKIV